jgi:oleandomycin transport system permease protein
MPGWLRAFTKVNPLSNLADACRALTDGGSAAGPIAITLAWALGIALLAGPLAVVKFHKAAR